MYIITIQNIKEPKSENNNVHNCVWRTVDVFIRIWSEKITVLTIYVVGENRSRIEKIPFSLP
jgi:hypothetical protein